MRWLAGCAAAVRGRTSRSQTGALTQDSYRIDWDDIERSVNTAVPDRATPVAVYCWNATCTGSEIVAAELEHLGYNNVYRYPGGKQDWTDHGGPLTTSGAS